MNAYLLLYTMEGEGLLVYGGKEHRLSKGRFFLIDCMYYQIYATAGNYWKFCWIHFRAKELKGYVDELYQKYGPVFVPDNPEWTERRICEINSLFQGYHPAAKYRVVGMLTDLFSMLYAQYAQADSIDGSEQISEDSVMVMNLMEETYKRKISLDEIASKVGRSKYYLAHQFKRDTGMSIYAYLTLLRISKSKVLLQNTNIQVAEIAEEVGFNSASNFIRTFAEYEGITPNQYRKQWQV